MSQIGEAFVRVRLDTTGVPNDMRRVERSVASANREVSRFGRGALVGTGALRELGRAAAFASLSFIGGAGVVVGLRSTIDAAMEAQVVLGQTRNAVRNAGISWAQWGDEIQKVALEQANLSGFDDERLLRTFSTLVTRTGDVSKAFELNALAADVARRRNIELEQAAQLVIRASLGQSGALRRLGIAAREGASGLELIDLISRKYHGGAAAFADTAAGAQARFNVALGNTQEAIGSALLPTLTRYLDKAAKWLSNTENQEKLQRGFQQTVDTSVGVMEALGEAIGQASDAYMDFRDATDELPGGKGGFFDTLISGTIVEQVKLLRDNIKGLQQDFDDLGVPGANATRSDFLGRRLGGLPGFPGQPSIIDILTKGETESGFSASFPQLGRQALEGGGVPRSRIGSRGEMTLTDLARAQASGDRAEITEAIRVRQQFIRDTIAFANKLIAEGRGDTGQLYTILQSFYGEQESLQGILDQFAAADERAEDEAEQNAKNRKRDAERRAEAWRDANHEIQLAFAAARRQGRLFHEAFIKRVREDAADARARQTQRFDTQVQVRENAILAAELIPDEDKALAAERKARRALIAVYQSRVDTLVRQKAGLNAIVRAKSDVLTAKKALRDLNKKERSGDRGGFSLQELFAEAGEQFDLYGSNVGGTLSPQDARHDFAGVLKSHQTTVVQNFYGEKGAGQALSDAARVAKNMKAG